MFVLTSTPDHTPLKYRCSIRRRKSNHERSTYLKVCRLESVTSLDWISIFKQRVVRLGVDVRTDTTKTRVHKRLDCVLKFVNQCRLNNQLSYEL